MEPFRMTWYDTDGTSLDTPTLATLGTRISLMEEGEFLTFETRLLKLTASDTVALRVDGFKLSHPLTKHKVLACLEEHARRVQEHMTEKVKVEPKEERSFIWT